MNKRQGLNGATYCNLKATREHKERKCAASLLVFQLNKYVVKAKCKDKDAECTSELRQEEQGDNANMEEMNIELKLKEEFLAGIKEIEGDNDDVLKEERSSPCGKERYEYEEGTDEVTENRTSKHRYYRVRRHRILTTNLLRTVAC